MADQNLINLVHQLTIATRSGRVKWADTADDDAFRVTLDYASIRLMHIIDPEFDRDFFHLLIVDPKGRTIDDLRSDDSDHPELYSLLNGLYQLARRSARESDAVVSRLLVDLMNTKGA